VSTEFDVRVLGGAWIQFQDMQIYKQTLSLGENLKNQGMQCIPSHTSGGTQVAPPLGKTYIVKYIKYMYLKC